MHWWGVLLLGVSLQMLGDEMVKWEAFTLPCKLSDFDIQITEPVCNTELQQLEYLRLKLQTLVS